MESHDANDIPIELKVPLPPSSACSDENEEKEKDTARSTQDFSEVQEEESHADTEGSATGGHLDVVTGKAELEEPLDPPSITLVELANLVDLEAYQDRRALSAQRELQQLRLSCGMDRRLVDTLSIAYGDMIDQYKTDDQAGFAGLFEACEQLKSSCILAAPSPSNANLISEETSIPGNATQEEPSITTLPLEDQDNILTFLTQIRTEPNFLADSISRLSPVELTALTSSYHPPGIDFSILQNHSHGKSQFFSRDSQMMKLSRRMDNLNWFHNQDPFFALLYGVFDSSARPGSREYTRRMETWSTTCARTIVEGSGGIRPGSDELVIAILEAFANAHDWPLTPKVEVLLMSILAKGAFLLEPLANQPVNPKEPLETHNAKAAVAEADYFENALSDLFDLLAADDIQRAVPASALAFARAVLRRIEDPKLRLRAQQFIAIRWYFATFLSSLAVYPEVRGIMMTQHIGETARRLILQKFVIKMQERAFDAVLPWNDSALLNPRIRDTILAIFNSFAPVAEPEKHELPAAALAEDEEASARFLLLTPLDIVGLVQALCPERLASQGPIEKGTNFSVSDRPSTAGSSTLVAGISDVGSAVITPTQPATGDPDLNELGLKERFAGLENPYDASNGKTTAPARMTPVFQKGLSYQIWNTCQKLKGISTPKNGSGSGIPPNAWTFVYYLKDGSTLSFEPIGIEMAGKKVHGAGTFPKHDTDPDNSDGFEAYQILKAAVVRLLQEDDQFGSKSIETISLSGSLDSLELLQSLMNTAMNKFYTSLDPVDAHLWWSNLQVCQEYLARHPSKSSRTLLRDIGEDLREAVDRAANVTKGCDLQYRSLGKLQKRNKTILTKLEELRNALRIKMWYVSDVRHSATYEEALYVTRALRTMASSRRPKQSGSISNWARQRLRGSYIHDRAEAQTLEAMVASKEHCGISKLADDQIELTSRWLTRRSIENFCKGEERIHRFCYEVQRSVGKIAGTSLLESPVLWSSNLFKRERLAYDKQGPKSHLLNPPSNLSFGPPRPFEAGRLLTTPIGASGPSPTTGSYIPTRSPTGHLGSFWNANPPVRQSTGLGLYGNQPLLPPTPTSPPMSWSNNSFAPGSPLHAVTAPMPANSAFSTSRSQSNSELEGSPAKLAFAEEIKKMLCTLLVSDLGYLLWNQGSETDTWIKDQVDGVETEPKTAPVVGRSTDPASSPGEAGTSIKDLPPGGSASGGTFLKEARLPTTTPMASQQCISGKAYHTFPFSKSYTTLLQRMSFTHDPYQKLRLLYELETLIIKSMANSASTVRLGSDCTPPPWHDGAPSLRSRSVPRTKATSLEEVIANCTERRAGTLRSQGSKATSAILTSELPCAGSRIPGADDIVNTLYSMFRSSKTRPPTLFRDLQYIAAFVPASTLDQTAQGKAFWDVGLAALALKEDLCESLIRRANTMTAYHVPPRTSLDPAADGALGSSTLRDAANLWLITAKEGSPVAARELGLFYLTHPELLPRVTMPFSKAKDVFRAVVPNDSRAGDKEKGALDPYTFAVVFHWMEIAANGGDKDARDFLKGNGDLSGGR